MTPEERANSKEQLLGELVPALKNREPTMTIRGQPAPPAFVIVTNHPYHYDLEGTSANCAAVAEGFKVPDFGASARFNSLLDAFKATRKYADLFRLMDALRNYQIPSTFDGEIPEFAFGEAQRRWVIGERYALSDREPRAVGVLRTAVVAEHSKQVYLTFQLQDGREVMTTDQLTDVELAAYRQHPDTFFGIHLHVSKEARDPLALFEFFYESYKNVSRERMLEFLRSANDFHEIEQLSDEEMLLVFCDRHVGAVMQKSSQKKSSGD